LGGERRTNSRAKGSSIKGKRKEGLESRACKTLLCISQKITKTWKRRAKGGKKKFRGEAKSGSMLANPNKVRKREREGVEKSGTYEKGETEI